MQHLDGTALDTTEITGSSAILWLIYKFINYAGSNRFTYKLSGDSWTNIAWCPKSGSSSYNQSISGLFQGIVYNFKAQLPQDSTSIEGEVKVKKNGEKEKKSLAINSLK
ncbi:MAG TPA: hypothetical protein DSN98_01980 [Thermoplasmata archaeon]|nr:MAG TPA: hypothetical protein DSN98_01980 [Thermoplasmata archaeon]